MNILRNSAVMLSFLAFFIGCSNVSKTHSLSSVPYQESENRTVADMNQPRPNEISISSSSTEALDRHSQAIVDKALSYCKKSQSCWQKNEPEEALAALDNAYSLILELDDQNNPAMAKRKEELRYIVSKRILEIHASTKTLAKGHHRAIPLEMNRHVQTEIKYLTQGDFFKNAYKRSGRYRQYISRELVKAGLPEELSWLPLIESGYKVRALSRARALGLWQFIPSTGHRFGLKRNRYIDERMDPYKSTHAAIAYLKALHDMFGDWATVLAAYNCGEGRVLDVIRSQQINYLDNFWDLYEQLPNETARYVPRFLATLHIVNNPGKYGINKITPDAPISFDTVTVSKRVTLKDVSKHIGVSADAMKTLNPELRRGMLPGTAYALKVPPGKKTVLLASLNRIPTARASRSVKPSRKKAQRTTVVYHRVKRGDTLTSIARTYRTSVRSIQRANHLRRSDTIVVGKRLKIPGGKAPVAVAKKTAAKQRPKNVVYTVKKGDTLWGIARRHGTSTRKIMTANRMKSKKVLVGQKLKIPSGGSTKIASNNTLKTYRVKRGDAPMDIAKRHKMTLQRLLHVNNLTYDSKIYPGQKLAVE